MDLTTVADDEVVIHDGATVRTYDGLEPDHAYELDGLAVRTLARPPGPLLCTVATVNDVHFGEVECGIIEGLEMGPTFRAAPGADPYPVVMNRGAVAELSSRDLAAVVAKGDLTSAGTAAEYQAFLDTYAPFGSRLHHVRGNHDVAPGAVIAPMGPRVVEVPGLRLALIDTTIAERASGQVTADTRAWLDDVAASPGAPILLFGHHQAWSPESRSRPDDYFGINPDDSQALVEVVARRPAIVGVFAGHTHRNRVRRFRATGDVPWVEVACVKDYPGSWAEYRVFEGGVLQIHRRISTPEALAWTEQTRQMFAGTYADYALGTLADRGFPIAWR